MVATMGLRRERAGQLLVVLDRFLEAASAVSRRRAKRRALLPIETTLTDAMGIAFRAQGKLLAAHFRRMTPTWTVTEAAEPQGLDWESIWVLIVQQTIDLFVTPIDEAIRAALLAGGAATIGELQLGISFDLANPRAVAFLEGHALEAAKHIQGTTREDIQRIVRQGVAEGWSPNRIAQEIIAQHAEYAEGRPQEHIDSRAHGIAVYESGQAYEAGNRVVADDLAEAGLEMQKSWLTVGDDRVEPECAGNEAQGWIPLAQPFQSGHQQPLAHYACRCSALYRRQGAGE